MSRLRAAGLIALAVVGGFVLLVIAASTADSVIHRGKVQRNVTLAGQALGGDSVAEVEAEVAAVAAAFTQTPVSVTVEGGVGFQATAEQVGLGVDEPATVRAVMDARRQGFALTRPFSWLQSLVQDHEVDVVLEVDEQQALDASVVLGGADLVAPLEAAVAVDEAGSIVVTQPAPGRGVDGAGLARSLQAVSYRDGPIEVSVGLVELPPLSTAEQAEAARVEAERLTASGLAVRAGDQATTIPPETLRTWLVFSPTEAGLTVSVDRARVEAELPDLLPEAGEPPVDAGAAVLDGVVVPIFARSGTGCCAPEAVDLVLDAMQQGTGGPVELPLTVREPQRTDDDLAAMRITELIGSFTTNHACCEARVTNIHRIADLLRGYIIEPGEMLSVNTVVGERTLEKGFVPGPAIYENNNIRNEVGGGISQFMTTLFNAAFFAGLDFGEYRAHSIYISRYPYGREATINYPNLDLQIVNSTPYGVLVWPSYTDTSITVDLYSTQYAVGEQTGQTRSPAGNCTRVVTERTRTYVDTGEQSVDTVEAVYAPSQGQTC